MTRTALRVVVVTAVMALAPGVTRAQDRPAVFLHGFGAEAGDWAETAERLRNAVAITPHLPDLPWRSPYEEQASTLQQRAEYSGLPASAVAIGHSNGGIVAREWTRLRPLDGIVTVGTPHRGAPIMGHLYTWIGFTLETPLLLNAVVDAFTVYTDWNWIFAFVEELLHWASDFSIFSVVDLMGTLGFDSALPVAAEMSPNSSYLASLNGGTNLAREASHVPNRVGIASVAHNYFYAGPARAIAPEIADDIAEYMYTSASALLAWSDYIFLEASPTDVDAMRQALALSTLAGYILSIDPVYCRLVSTVEMDECLPNDGIVPLESQLYPGAPNLVLGANNDGPAHKQEKQMSADALQEALKTYIHVPARGASVTPVPDPEPAPAPVPEPEPTPEPEPSPAPEPDPWTEPAPEPPTSTDPDPAMPPDDAPDPDEWPEDGGGPMTIVTGELHANEYLWPGDTLDSTTGNRHLSYQGDGNLVIYDGNWLPMWASDTPGLPAGFVAMQADGNLVVYDPAGIPLWASDTAGHPGAWLAVQNDGNVVIYDVDGVPLWATDTF